MWFNIPNGFTMTSLNPRDCDNATRRLSLNPAGVCPAAIGVGPSDQQVMTLGSWSDGKLVARYNEKMAIKVLPEAAPPQSARTMQV
jgi:hypothetical protein